MKRIILIAVLFVCCTSYMKHNANQSIVYAQPDSIIVAMR